VTGNARLAGDDLATEVARPRDQPGLSSRVAYLRYQRIR
jgi:hypothetical protein